MSLPEDDPDAWRASVKASEVATGPKLLRPLAPGVEWFYGTAVPRTRRLWSVVVVMLGLELVDVALHVYEVFSK